MYLSLLLQELPGLAGLEKLSLVGALAIAIWWLVRKLGEKDKQVDSAVDALRSNAQATENVAEALVELRHEIRQQK